MKNRKFVKVRWKDAHCISGAAELSETELPHAPAMYNLWGFVLREDEVGITLAAEESDNNTYRGISFIPAGMIVEVEEFKLSVKKPKKPKPTSTSDPAPQASPTQP